MKYLKISVMFFAAVIVLSSFGVSAQSIDGITIPAFSGTWNAPVQEKYTDSIQKAKKISCKDNVSGDGRVILGATSYPDYLVSHTTTWKEIGYSFVDWGSENNKMGVYTLRLKSKKSLITKATFSGEWNTDN